MATLFGIERRAWSVSNRSAILVISAFETFFAGESPIGNEGRSPYRVAALGAGVAAVTWLRDPDGIWTLFREPVIAAAALEVVNGRGVVVWPNALNAFEAQRDRSIMGKRVERVGIVAQPKQTRERV